MSDYTPTTEWVIAGWMKARASDGITADIAFEEINRWLSEVQAEAYENATKALTIGPTELIEIRAEAWEEGETDGEWNYQNQYRIARGGIERITNPYRQGEKE